jgi:16S rRNA processing protein RimM
VSTSSLTSSTDPEPAAGQPQERSPDRPRLEIGRITRPHGVRGEVIVELVSNRPGRLVPRARLVAAGGTGASPVNLEVAHARPLGGDSARARAERLGVPVRWLVAFKGIDDRGTAESWRGATLCVDASDDEGELWVHRLVGCRVVDTAGTLLGVVAAVEANPAADLLVLGDGGLVPLSFVRGSDEGVIVADPPPGLLDR